MPSHLVEEPGQSLSGLKRKRDIERKRTRERGGGERGKGKGVVSQSSPCSLFIFGFLRRSEELTVSRPAIRKLRTIVSSSSLSRV